MAKHLTIFVVTFIPAAIILSRVFGRWLRSYFVQQMTVLYDIPNLGTPRRADQKIKGAAVICGGSIAGLWAARVCADHFEEVVIVEPESWLSTEDGVTNIFDENGRRLQRRGLHQRSRVPQYLAQHVFQPIALIALRHLFPDFDEDIRQVDGRILDADYNLCTYGKVVNLPNAVYPDANFSKVFFITRESYERILRRRVLSFSDRIRWVAGTATDVTAHENGPMILNSVIVRTETGKEESIPVSLVIDCSGASQVGFKWLKRLFADPERSTMLRSCGDVPNHGLPFEGDLRVEYNTLQRYRKFRVYVPPEIRSRLPIPGGYDNAGWIFTYMPRPGLERKLFMIERMEGHRIEWAFGGWGDPPLPESFDEVKGWLQDMGPEAGLPEWIFDLIDELADLKDEHGTELGKYPSCSWIRYERAPYIPSNFVAIGDSVMRVNPTFGQGCSKAVIGAIALDSLLRRPSVVKSTVVPADFGRKFFKVHSAKITGTWDGTKPIDYQWDTTTPVKGEKLSDEWLTGKMSALLLQLAGTDAEVFSALWHVRTFLAPHTDLLHPRILLKGLLLHVRQRLGLA